MTDTIVQPVNVDQSDPDALKETAAPPPAEPRPVPTVAELMQQCQGLVRSLAKQIHLTLPPSADLEDLISYGQVGLAEAARSFNPDVNVKFSTFAYYRIRGAIFDGVSKMAWFRKPSAAQARFERGANAVLDESSGEPGSDVYSDARWLNDVSRTLAVAYLTSQSRPLELEDDDCEDPAVATADRELSERLHDLVDRLPAEAQSLVRGVYFEGLSLQEAGERLGVSKSWASRLHSRILDRLGRELRRLGAD
jgi:RNA polymerase sigma factor for flagellar operon FliA